MMQSPRQPAPQVERGGGQRCVPPYENPMLMRFGGALLELFSL